MGPPSSKRARKTGPTGTSPGHRLQHPSWRRKDVLWGDLLVPEVHAARIYFATDEHVLTSDDRKVVIDLARELRPWLFDGGRVWIRCEGRADPRHDEGHNQRLSAQRAASVVSGLRFLLDTHRNCSFQSCGQGETGASPLADLWAEDRRVDVFVKLKTPTQIAVEQNPYPGYWANIFKNYYPRYSLWVERGLEHLVDEIERDDRVTIRREEAPKVLDLLGKIASPSDYQAAVVQSEGSGGTAVVAEYYEPCYRRAWQEAFERYRKAYLEYWDAHPRTTHEERVRIVSSGGKSAPSDSSSRERP
jgi:hypothetical protein